MLTNSEARYLINVEKVLENPNDSEIDLNNDKIKLDLISLDAPDYRFFIQIYNNKKIQFKVSLHHQESTINIGLLRIDFKGRHQNPESIKPSLPDEFHKYVGKFFDINEPHVHIFVEGYKPLSWALPLLEFPFQTKEINNIDDFNSVIINFTQAINLISQLSIQQSIL